MIILILSLALIGFLAYLITTYIPMPPPIRTAIIVIVVICMVLYLISVLGIADLPVPRVGH